MIDFHSLPSVGNHVCEVDGAIVSSIIFLLEIREHYEQYLQLETHQIPHGQTAFDGALLWGPSLLDESRCPLFIMRYRCDFYRLLQ